MAGLSGISLFASAVIISARIKFFENFFYGINRAYIDHHNIGAVAFCLLLFHPLFFAYDYFLIFAKNAALFFLPTANWAFDFGETALFIMTVALIITFYIKLKYQVWKFSHKFLGVSFTFAVFHAFFIGSDITENAYLEIYFLILGALAIASFLYRAVFGRYLVKRTDYTVQNTYTLPDSTIELELIPKEKGINFLPGQFIFIDLIDRNINREPHPFSISSASGSPLKIAIKELGDYTNKIRDVKRGSLAKIEGPFGAFSFKNHTNKKQIWIAGGIGITPFMSMMRSLAKDDLNYNIVLYYSAKTGQAFAFADEIKQAAQKYKDLRPVFWATDEKGFITAEKIIEELPDAADRDVLICGPRAMMFALKTQFLKAGFKKPQIHIEEFKLYL